MANDAALTPGATFVGMTHDAHEFIDRIRRIPVRDWLQARDSTHGMGPALAWAVEIAEKAVDENGLRDEYRAAERRVVWLVDGIEWFARESNGAHGITMRDIGALRLLATWAALGVLVRDHVGVVVFDTLTHAFRPLLVA